MSLNTESIFLSTGGGVEAVCCQDHFGVTLRADGMHLTLHW